MHQVGAGHGRRRRNWCKGNGRTRTGGISCTKSAPATGEETRGTWCKGNGRTRASGISCTKSAPATGEKTRGTWCKGNGRTRAAGFRAPSWRRPRAKKRVGLGAKGTEEQGIAGFRAPSRPAGPAPLPAAPTARRPARHAAPPPVHTEVYKLPHDNKSVLKGNFFCGIILSPERNQRCNTGNNMKGDAI